MNKALLMLSVAKVHTGASKSYKHPQPQNYCKSSYEIIKNIFYDWDHRIILASFFVVQFVVG